MIRILSFIFLLMAFTSNANAKTVHWISIFDTNDSNIGRINENGREGLFEHIVKPYTIVLDSLGYENNLYRFCGDDYKIDKLLHTIQSIKSSPEDLIFIYSVGHGNAMPDSCNTQLPMLMFSNDKSGWIPLDYIREQVTSKDYRAAVMITVSSNSKNGGINCYPKEYFDSIRISNVEDGIVLPIPIKDVKNTFLTDNESRYIKELVSSLSGTIMSISTQKGLDSLAGNTPLGQMDLFTCVLIKTLEDNALTGKQPNILETLDDIRKIVSDVTDGTQLPFYQITNAK